MPDWMKQGMQKRFFWIIVCLLAGLVACGSQDTDPAATEEPAAAWPADPEKAAVQLVEWLAAGRYDLAVQHFDATMREVLPASGLQDAWVSLNTAYGLFQQTAGTRVEVQEPYRLVYVTCEFEQEVLDTRVVLNQEGEVAGLFFTPAQPAAQAAQEDAPEYADPAAIREEEMVVGSGVWKMPGTLTLPAEGGPFPAVVLVHGSGPNDRDETIGPNKPFRDLAWGLATRGIAVLRYDKRTLTYATQMAAQVNELTVDEETVQDAVAVVQLLRYDARIQADRIFVLGHSLGGMLASRIATQSDNVAGLIIMAGNTRPLEDLISEQVAYIAELDGTVSAEEQEQIDALAEQVTRVKDPALSLDTPAESLPLGIPAAYWLDLRAYDPAAMAANLDLPLLVLQGGRDYQVTTQDYEGWQAALAGQGTAAYQFYPDLNHLFIAGDGPGSPAEYQISGHVAPEVIRDISDWISNQ